jgi:hypothetical protein
MSNNLFNDIWNWFAGTSDKPTKTSSKRKTKKVFISFAIEDKVFRNLLVNQAKYENSPFDFTDMSVKEAWNNETWKRQCRKRIRECDAMIALISKHTWHAGGARWEMKCARQEGVKLMGMHIKKDDKGAIPPELSGVRVSIWSWANLEKFLK